MSADETNEPLRQPIHPDDVRQPAGHSHQSGQQHQQIAVAQAPQMPLMPQPLKDTTAAWLLLVFLGGFGGHDFYLKSPGLAVTKMLISLVSVPLMFIFIGFIPATAVFIWNVVDAFRMGDRLQEVNTKIWQQNQRAAAQR